MVNILFLASKKLGEKAFEHILSNLDKNKYCIKCTSSNKNKDSYWWNSNNVYTLSQDNHIDFFDMENKDMDMMANKINYHNIDMIISVQYQWIISEDILKLVNYNAINLHNAKLPHYKGYNSINMHILNQEKTYTSTWHQMSALVDSGNIILEKTFNIPKNIVANKLYDMSIENSFLLVKEMVYLLNSGNSMPSISMSSKGKFYPRSTIDEKQITHLDSIEQMALKSRAFYFPDFEGAYFIVDDKKYYVVPEV